MSTMDRKEGIIINNNSKEKRRWLTTTGKTFLVGEKSKDVSQTISCPFQREVARKLESK